MNIGIIGTGTIARKMAQTIKAVDGMNMYAIASRSLEKAEAFAKEFGAEKAYGSYQELAEDSKTDLVYIATPNSEHYANAKMCLENGRAVICEKPFTVNAEQAEELFKVAESKKIFITEAMWIRFLPMQKMLKEIVKSGEIGSPVMLTANLGYDIHNKERLTSPELGGGALLDLGVYPINFAAMIFGNDIERIETDCVKAENGVDLINSMIFRYRKGRLAALQSCMTAGMDERGMIYGTKGRIEVKNINNIESITVTKNDGTVKNIERPEQITGFEYELLSAAESIKNGLIECPEMPHSETLKMMRIMDSIRRRW